MEVIEGKSFLVPLKLLPSKVKELIMVWIAPGTSIIGSPESEPGRTFEDANEGCFEATFSRGFWLGQYLITQSQWQAVMNDNPSHYQPCPDCPIENVSWHQTMSFCTELNKLFASMLPPNYQFSLPTEAQWEYCCRAGTQTVYYTGDDPASLARAAWHRENSGGRPYPVGEKEPNLWGLYDMHGNVAEWCYDATSDYPNGPAVDWIGQVDENVRSLRGGGWSTPPQDSSFRCSRRGWLEPEKHLRVLGFRLCLRMVASKS